MWTPYEEAYLRIEHGYKPLGDIARALGKKPHQVRQKARYEALTLYTDKQAREQYRVRKQAHHNALLNYSPDDLKEYL